MTVKKALKRLARVMIWIVAVFFACSLSGVIIYRFVPPPATLLVYQRILEHSLAGKEHVIYKKWVPLHQISPHLVQAVVASEDNRFMEHFGLDLEAIRKAREHNKKGKRVRGASTISQQTAKNVFLWPSRTYTRKALEVYFTWIIEIGWGKRRIMEVYLNVIEMGNGIYGAEAAAQVYFKKPAAKLTRQEAALIASALPNPRHRNPGNPSGYMWRRQARIQSLMTKIEPVKFD